MGKKFGGEPVCGEIGCYKCHIYTINIETLKNCEFARQSRFSHTFPCMTILAFGL